MDGITKQEFVVVEAPPDQWIKSNDEGCCERCGDLGPVGHKEWQDTCGHVFCDVIGCRGLVLCFNCYQCMYSHTRYKL